MFLLDTNVISETRKPRPHAAVMAWLADTPDSHLRLSAATLGELQGGVEKSRRTNPQKAAEIEVWIDGLGATFDVIPVDEAVFRLWARLMDRKSEHLLIDALIVATAEVHGLTVATRNVRDFEALGVRVINPFEGGRSAR